MHLKSTIKRSLLLLSAIVVVATSCVKDYKRLGGDIIPDDYSLNIGKAIIKLPLQAKVIDSLQALDGTYGYLGAIRTPEFGLAKFSFATGYAPNTTSFNFGKDAVVKDIQLVLLKNSYSVANNNELYIPQNIHVYRMTRVVDSLHKYQNDFKPEDYIDSQLEDGACIYTGGDTLRIFLKKSFGEQLLKASKNALDSTERFLEEFKGLLFTCDEPSDGVEGGRLNSFSTSTGYISLRINFQPTWGNSLPRKDSIFLFNLGREYTQNISTYQSIEKEDEEPSQYVNIEGIAGLKPYVSGVALKDSIDKLINQLGIERERFIIARARYYLPFEVPTIAENINNFYPTYLYPNYKFRVDSKNHYYTPVEDIYSPNNNCGMFNRSLGYYYGDISSWMQNLALKDRSEVASNPSYNMWFASLTPTTSSSYFSSSSTTTTYSINLDRYNVGRINGNLHENYPYLELIYTILPKE